MKIKSIVPVGTDYAVLATRRADFSGLCYDRQGDGHSYFWAVVDGGAGDYIELIDVDVDGNQRICDRRLVVHKRNCPFCNQQMDPMYDNGHEPIIWQESALAVVSTTEERLHPPAPSGFAPHSTAKARNSASPSKSRKIF